MSGRPPDLGIRVVELRGIEPLTSPCHAASEPSHTSGNVRQTTTQSESIQRSGPTETPCASGKPSLSYDAVRVRPLPTGDVSVSVTGYVRGYVGGVLVVATAHSTPTAGYRRTCDPTECLDRTTDRSGPRVPASRDGVPTA
jgi:hypothetical protein